jgi:protein required for attachment to host cells
MINLNQKRSSLGALSKFQTYKAAQQNHNINCLVGKSFLKKDVNVYGLDENSCVKIKNTALTSRETFLDLTAQNRGNDQAMDLSRYSNKSKSDNLQDFENYCKEEIHENVIPEDYHSDLEYF